ncbi:hypothetical protein ACGF07_25630 [Kitasatospora sp. NPDC048194]|uniref:hypothetical protein n=1 Tax=Kitasatospora sp. NPDC048194 TaxID=3364045 RepID=UPI003711D362
MTDLARRLAETHRPIFEPDPCAVTGSSRYLTYCRACSRIQAVWRPGDPIPTCELWDAAVAACLIEPETGPTA